MNAVFVCAGRIESVRVSQCARALPRLDQIQPMGRRGGAAKSGGRVADARRSRQARSLARGQTNRFLAHASMRSRNNTQQQTHDKQTHNSKRPLQTNKAKSPRWRVQRCQRTKARLRVLVRCASPSPSQEDGELCWNPGHACIDPEPPSQKGKLLVVLPGPSCCAVLSVRDKQEVGRAGGPLLFAVVGGGRRQQKPSLQVSSKPPPQPNQNEGNAPPKPRLPKEESVEWIKLDRSIDDSIWPQPPLDSAKGSILAPSMDRALLQEAQPKSKQSVA